MSEGDSGSGCAAEGGCGVSDEEEELFEEAWEVGTGAAHTGSLRSSNPYEPGSIAFKGWDEGWADETRELKRAQRGGGR